MIELTRLSGDVVTINAELIESLEAVTGHTVVSLTTKNRYSVKEPVDEIVEKVIKYRQRVNAEKAAKDPIAGHGT